MRTLIGMIKYKNVISKIYNKNNFRIEYTEILILIIIINILIEEKTQGIYFVNQILHIKILIIFLLYIVQYNTHIELNIIT